MPGEAVEGAQRLAVFLAQGALLGIQHAPVESLGLGQAALIVEQPGLVAHGLEGIGTLGALDGRAPFNHLPQQGGGLRVAGSLHQGGRQMAGGVAPCQRLAVGVDEVQRPAGRARRRSDSDQPHTRPRRAG